MSFYESVRVAMLALAANKLRSVLTMLGIIIGVSAVIALMSIGRGVEKFFVEQFTSLGTNLLYVFPGQLDDGPRQGGRDLGVLTLGDSYAIGNPLRVPDVIAVAPEVRGNALVARSGNDMDVSVSGVTASYQDALSGEAAIGVFLTDTDVEERSRVVVIGSDVFGRLFEPNEDPIDQTIRVNNILFRVIGVMEERGAGVGGSNLDEMIFIPLTTVQDRLFRRRTVSGEYQVNLIYASVVSEDRMDAAQEQIAELLRERHNISFRGEDDFVIINQSDLISIFGDILGAMTLFLSAIAFISLVVGGIGIMNIMLVSVTERTREIGLRKAVGAKRRNVLGQFLIEAVTLALIGGMLGIALGAGGAVAATSFVDNFSAVVGFDAIAISILFSMAVGLFFGIYPAYRASRLNPIDALRYE
ncbi:MAG: ABC transporter permease [Caldilineaceae bacterium]|nr:ABC transporter permease [Caldilineaceae bacterium]MDE0633106.1 ABC transporter permease [Caldilineaceae bacterium]MXZ75601.1 FtsX-like permease family protein [Gemmatimonadota bacterium]